MKLNRRQALFGVTSALLLPAGCAVSRAPAGVLTNEVFAHGVASGDPDATSVVLWTRVSGRDAATDVDWAVAADRDMTAVVASGRATTDASRDFTVKVLASRLQPGRTYYYSFAAAGMRSPTGRTRTLPDGSPDKVTIAVASCSNFPFGYFNAYEAIADDPAVDVVVHLGDYIYEYDEDGYGGSVGKRLGRVHEPRHETVTLADYRTRHAQYKAEPGSLALHAAHPLIPTWDDHETTNNPWTGGAENHQAGEGDWAARRAASLRAYYEWMPVREPAGGSDRARRWQHYRFGDLASLVTLETRHTARSKQIEIGDYEDRLTGPAEARAFYDEVVGAPDRRMLSADMEDFLQAQLAESVQVGRPWRVIANQTILARVVAPNLDEPQFERLRAGQPESNEDLLDMLTGYGRLELAANMDAWDGYPAARERLYALADAAGARDLLVVTGDTHVFWQNRLANAAGEPMGVELGTSAISSPRGFYQLGPEATVRFDQLVMEQNDSVVWADGRYRGYVRLTLRRDRARADYVTVSDVESAIYRVRVLRSANIVRSEGTLSYA